MTAEHEHDDTPDGVLPQAIVDGEDVLAVTNQDLMARLEMIERWLEARLGAIGTIPEWER